MARRFAPGLRRRPGLHHEMEHGLDARHARLLRQRPRVPQISSATTSPSACCTRSPKTSCCRFRMTKWCTARGSLISKMPGDEWQRFANMRAFLAYMFGHPGKKLLFMGTRIRADRRMESRRAALPWQLLQYAVHSQAADHGEGTELVSTAASRRCIKWTTTIRGFEWIDFRDAEASVISFRCATRRIARISGLLLQFHAGAARQAIGSVFPPRRLRGNFQYRCGDVRRREHGQRRVCAGRG